MGGRKAEQRQLRPQARCWAACPVPRAKFCVLRTASEGLEPEDTLWTTGLNLLGDTKWQGLE